MRPQGRVFVKIHNVALKNSGVSPDIVLFSIKIACIIFARPSKSDAGMVNMRLTFGRKNSRIK